MTIEASDVAVALPGWFRHRIDVTKPLDQVIEAQSGCRYQYMD